MSDIDVDELSSVSQHSFDASVPINDDLEAAAVTKPLIPQHKDPSYYAKWDSCKYRILIVSSLSPVLNPLTGSFFLPALPSIISEFDATSTEIALVYSLYLLIVAFSKLLWGPFVDKYSRKWCLLLALLQYTLCSYFTGFSRSMWFLILLRTISGIPMSSFFLISTAIISDIFHPNQRGFAMGIRSVPMLINILFGGPIGGLLTLYVGWRSTVLLLAILGCIVFLLSLFMVPETLDKEKARSIQFSILSPLKTLLNFRIFCITLAGGISMGALFLTSFMVTTVLASLYSINALSVGFCLVPSGIGGVIGSFIGGKLSDKIAKRYGRGGRLLFSIINLNISGLLFILFAASLMWNVWIPVLLSFVVGGFRGTSGSGFSTFAIEEFPRNVSAVIGGTTSGYMLISFLLMFISPIIAPVISWTLICTILFVITLVVSIPCVIIALSVIKEFKNELKETVPE